MGNELLTCHQLSSPAEKDQRAATVKSRASSLSWYLDLVFLSLKSTNASRATTGKDNTMVADFTSSAMSSDLEGVYARK